MARRRVLVKLSERKNNRGRREGTVIRVLRRADRELTGRAGGSAGNAYFVQPVSKKYPEVAIDRHHLGDAQPGDRVAVSISCYGDEKLPPQGVVEADLGEDGTMEAAIAGILHENGVYDVFPTKYCSRRTQSGRRLILQRSRAVLTCATS